jgi:hypothetical protein
MRFVLAFLLVAHGVAHLVGFVSSWKLATLAELPDKTAVFLGRVDVGDAGIRVMGVLWPYDSRLRLSSRPSSCAWWAGLMRALAWLSMWDSHFCSRLAPV